MSQLAGSGSTMNLTPGLKAKYGFRTALSKLKCLVLIFAVVHPITLLSCFSTFPSIRQVNVRRNAREPGQASGSASKASSAVVDDSDLSDLPSEKLTKPDEGTKKKKKSFDSLIAEADAFSTKAERASKKSTAMVSLEDELKGLSIEDDTELDAIMMATARGGKASDVSLSTRLTKWLEETKELIQNPTKQQVTYGVIFASSIGLLVLMFVITFALGGIRLQGDGVETARRRTAKLNDAYMQSVAIMREQKKRLAEMDDIRAMNSDFYADPATFLNFNTPKLEDIKPEDVLGQ